MKGATAQCLSDIGKFMGFNPRTREGCDGDGDGRRGLSAGVSIHAPVKGATG